MHYDMDYVRQTTARFLKLAETFWSNNMEKSRVFGFWLGWLGELRIALLTTFLSSKH